MSVIVAATAARGIGALLGGVSEGRASAEKSPSSFDAALALADRMMDAGSGSTNSGESSVSAAESAGSDTPDSDTLDSASASGADALLHASASDGESSSADAAPSLSLAGDIASLPASTPIVTFAGSALLVPSVELPSVPDTASASDVATPTSDADADAVPAAVQSVTAPAPAAPTSGSSTVPATSDAPTDTTGATATASILPQASPSDARVAAAVAVPIAAATDAASATVVAERAPVVSMQTAASTSTASPHDGARGQEPSGGQTPASSPTTPATSFAPSGLVTVGSVTGSSADAAPSAPRTVAAQVAPAVLSIVQRPVGTHQLTMTVNPDTLGPVTVRAQISAGGEVRVELVGATDAGRDALRTIVADLRRDLAAVMPHASLALGSSTSADAGATDRGPSFGADGSARDQGSGERDRGRAAIDEAPDPSVTGMPRILPITTHAVAGEGLDIFA